MRHPKLAEWESKLKRVIDAVDDAMESKYQGKYRLHPARPAQGSTSNKAHDGLFDIVTSFTLGKGSETGRGYVVDVRLSTLEEVPGKVKEEIEAEAIQIINEQLPKVFGDTDLKAVKDGPLVKIYGNLTLGEV